MVEELMRANEQQKAEKEIKLAEQAKVEKEEYSRIIESQLKAQEEERRKEEERQKMKYDHNEELKRHYINHPELGISCLNTKIHHTAIHTGYHTDIIGTIDSVSEFFIMGRSKKIVALSNSGFSFWSAFIHDVPLYKYSNNQLEIMNTINY